MTTRPVLLSVAEAQARLLAMARPVAGEMVVLVNAAGRWAADDIVARRTQPYADLSAMDGYAIRHADLPGPFTQIGESAAGHPFGGVVGAGQTVRIFTGAALPNGADTVMVQEEARVDGAVIALAGDGPGRRGANVRRHGLDFNDGDLLVARGDRLTPARLALAGAGGHGTVAVNRLIRVALIATGDELVRPGATVPDGGLPETNAAMLAAMLANLPVEVIDLGIVPDRLDAMTQAFARAQAELIITTGGASVGDHDLVRPALEAAGGTIDFWRIALRPGKPMLAGTLGDALVVGLPGNPVSAFVTATLFVRPLIATLGGARDAQPLMLAASLAEPLPANDGRQDYLRARVADGRVSVAAVQDSSMLRALAAANCLVVRPPHAPAAAAGDQVAILPIA
ncbi:MAG: molybdopterin molybdotransferase MoeA [Sphingomonas sp.]